MNPKEPQLDDEGKARGVLKRRRLDHEIRAVVFGPKTRMRWTEGALAFIELATIITMLNRTPRPQWSSGSLETGLRPRLRAVSMQASSPTNQNTALNA